MNTFGDSLRAKLTGDAAYKKAKALKAADEWIHGEVAQNLESALERAVEEGEEHVLFRHTYINGFRPETADVETLSSFQFFKTRCEELGLEYLAMSHQAMGDRKPPEYPLLEIKVSVPPTYRSELS